MVMNYYIEITLRPTVDIGPYFILEKVFGQIHKELVNKQQDGKVPVGLSFPQYDLENHLLGQKVRLLAAGKEILAKMEITPSLRHLQEYVHVTGIRTIPDRKLSYANYTRIQPKSSNARLARRKAKRQGIPLAQAEQILNQYAEQRVKTPFVNIRSQSTQHRFRLFILKRHANVSVNDGFSCYGLSATSTVPEF